MENWFTISWTGHRFREQQPTFPKDVFNLEEYPILYSLVYSSVSELMKKGKKEFFHPAGIDYNPVHNSICNYFVGRGVDKIGFSKELINIHFDKIANSKIKAGNILIGEFTFDEETVIFILKVESYDSFISFDEDSVKSQAQGINSKSKYLLTAVKTSQAHIAYSTSVDEQILKYWDEDFMGLKPLNDSYFLTEKLMTGIASFAKEKIGHFDDDLFESTKFLRHSIAYVKEHENFDLEKFEQSVFRNDDRLSTLFSVHLDDQEVLEDISGNSFEISKAAIKTHQSKFSRSINLDDDVVISLKSHHVNLVRGFDRTKGLKTLTIYFKEEK